MDFELQKLADVYRAESAENIASMEGALLAIERTGTADAEQVNAMLRAAHTLKGNSATIGFDSVAQAAHAMEDTLQRVRDSELACTREVAAHLLESVDKLRDLLRLATLEQVATPTPVTPVAVQPPVRAASLRVNLSRLDRLLDLTGEITIARGRLAQLLGGSGDGVLSSTLWQLEQLHSALHGEVMRLRMVPLGPGFHAQERTARDVARQRGKEVRLVIEGGDVEVDTSIADQLRDPLTHMIRNAVDHGIESPAERLAAGKPSTGRVTLRASHQAGTVVIEIHDDGRGLDRKRITERAVARGLIATAEGFTDDQVFAFIFEPGFSTADEITAVSGRGVGMDVVRRQVRALRGTIEVASTPGAGTRLTLRLPLTVAIIGGLLVRAGGGDFVVPMDAVEEVVDVSTTSTDARDTGILEVRGAAVPWASVTGLFGRRYVDPRDVSLVRRCAVILRSGRQRVGLVVDSVDGDCQAVIKPLAHGLDRIPGIAGSTILGSGRVALILDVPQMVERITGSSTARAQSAAA